MSDLKNRYVNVIDTHDFVPDPNAARWHVERGGSHTLAVTNLQSTLFFQYFVTWGHAIVLNGQGAARTVNGWEGMTLQIETRMPQHPGTMDFVNAAWERFRDAAESWLWDSDSQPVIELPLPHSRCWMAIPNCADLPPAAFNLRFDYGKQCNDNGDPAYTIPPLPAQFQRG
jgi:hypothetical protein